ncbi:MAG: hypothetical protein AAF216_15445 [Pseudomonadota bacterium]
MVVSLHPIAQLLAIPVLAIITLAAMFSFTAIITAFWRIIRNNFGRL